MNLNRTKKLYNEVIRPFLRVCAVIGRAFCKHKFERVSLEFELQYGTHYFGKVAEHKCSKCGKEEMRTTSNIYIKLPYL